MCCCSFFFSARLCEFASSLWGRRIWSRLIRPLKGKILSFQFQRTLVGYSFSRLVCFSFFQRVSICCMTYYFYLESLLCLQLWKWCPYSFLRESLMVGFNDSSVWFDSKKKRFLGSTFFLWPHGCSFTTQVTLDNNICDHFSVNLEAFRSKQ